MDERIHGVLDDEVPLASLEAAEAREFAAAGEAIREAVRWLEREEPQDCAAEVMARIGALEAVRRRGRARAAARWLWQARTVSVRIRPAYGLLAAAALAAVLVLPRAALRRGEPEPGPRVFVAFRLDAPGAGRVALAGDFTDWKPSYELHESAPGVWSVVVPVEPGVHDYAFVVDGGRWTPDPLAPAVADGFGGVNSRLAVLPPIRARSS